MRLPGRTDYALRAALELAASPDGPITTDELSQRQDIPTSYLGAILAEMRKAGIVRARRGPDGGWTLARPAADISLADVIRAIDRKKFGRVLIIPVGFLCDNVDRNQSTN